MGIASKAAAGALLWAAAAVTVASTLQISPVTIEMAPMVNGAAMTLSNSGDTPIYGQLRVYRWDQSDGEDVLSPTETLVASPPLVQIAPGHEQLVRIVQTGRKANGTEHSYRVVIDEIVDESAMQRSGVHIQMRYSVPVFVDNGLPRRAAPDLEWTLLRGPDRWQLRVENHGLRRARISAVQLSGAGGHTYDIQPGLLGYALAGRYRVWDLDVPSNVELGPQVSIDAVVNSQAMAVTASQDRISGQGG